MLAWVIFGLIWYFAFLVVGFVMLLTNALLKLAFKTIYTKV
jgi:hypothetical protein